MQPPASNLALRHRAARRGVMAEPPVVRWLLIGTALAFLGLFLFLPLAAVFAEASAKGLGYYLHSFADANTAAAIRLTFLTAAIAVP